jgi:hypothetical protein
MKIFWTFVGLLLTGSAYGQLLLYPKLAAPKQSVANTNRQESVLNLPFFDDFLGNAINANLWENSGATITNGVAVHPVSRGVATLDSYNAQGEAYNLSSPLATGFSDTLTSKPIDLSTFSPSDSVYLSFFWQAQGLGEQPDLEDFIRLEAKRINGTWQTIWQKNGDALPNPNFEQVTLPINQTEFLHGSFQFRFLRYGKISGNFDVWHIDYVYLNNNRTATNLTYPDIATTQVTGSYLKNYTSMPAKHFFESSNPSQFLNDKITFTLNNLDATFRVLTYQCKVLDSITNTQVATLPITELSANAPLIFPTDTYQLQVSPQVPVLPITTTKAILKTQLEVNTSDNNTNIPPIDFRRNDTISLRTVLDDYYAYDDGEAEYVAGINQRLGRIAVKFPIAQESQLTDIDIAFVPFIKDLRSQTFVLSVWKTIGGRNQEVLFQRSVQVKYPNKPNGFVRFSVDSFQVVKAIDTIYVGIQQTTDDLLAIGFDANHDNGSQIYFNTSGIWEQDANIRGSLMIRPVFKKDIVNSIDDEKLEDEFVIYPNPAENSIQIQSPKASIKHIWLTDLQGRVQNSTWQSDEKKLNFQLPKGMYIVSMETQQGKIVRKKLLVK